MDRCSAHISRLHKDILYYIFQLNTDTYLEEKSNSSDDCGQTSSDPHVLNDIRHASQVCQSWRDLIINSPTIWGNIIDLNFLWKQNELWRTEVMRRTGNSKLSVKGVVECEDLETFFVDLLKHHWPRIRKLDITIDIREFLGNVAWELQRPAPYLEFFKMDIGERSHGLSYLTQLPSLFSDEVPSLREFHFTYTRGVDIGFTLQAPWLRQLLGVTLPVSLTVSDILDSLVNMPLLESLKVQNPELGASASCPCVHLPRLSLITMKVGVREATLLLEGIVAAPACALVLNIFEGRVVDVSVEDIIALHKIILRYALGYFGSRTAEGLTYGFLPQGFSLHFPPLNASVIRRKPVGFAVDMFFSFPARRKFFGTDDSVSSYFFSHVKTWYMRDDVVGHERGWESQASFYSLFPFVEVLQASDSTLLRLLDDIEEDPCIWSQLHTLKITNKSTLITTSFSGSLLAFLDQREDDGLPIKVLDITEQLEGKRRIRNWQFLERKVGLEVVWVLDGISSSYICGSGTPDKLRL